MNGVHEGNGLKMLDLFSGIGGFRLAAQRVWGESLDCKCMVEINVDSQKILRKTWPGVQIHDDIKTFKGSGWGSIDLLTGGFPCQPYSSSGKKRADQDTRALWPEMFRIIRESQPRWVVGENVARFEYLGLDSMLSDMESIGYKSISLEIPVSAIKAPYSRKRWYMVFNSESIGYGEGRTQRNVCSTDGRSHRIVLPEPTLSGWWDTEPRVVRVANGIPRRVDRIRGLGNAVVPELIEKIFWGLRCVDEALCTQT